MRMSSCQLNDSENTSGLTSHVVAIDGIAVIVNKNNPGEELTREQGKPSIPALLFAGVNRINLVSATIVDGIILSGLSLYRL
jgi:hypothetical protein